MDAARLTPPPGLAARSLTAEDAQAVTDVVATCELADDGAVEIARSDVEADWARPTFDAATMSIGVVDGERLVAFGEVFMGRAEVDVIPAYRGRGIGTSLMRWTWDVARADGRDTVGQTVNDRRAGAASLLRANGYEPRHTSWVLRIDLDEEPPRAALPDGLAFRDLVPGRDDRALFELIDTAFDEWPDRESHGFENWRAEIVTRAEVKPALVPLIVAGDRIVGAAVTFDYGELDEGWVQQLAVDAAFRRRGLGKALLHESFRRFRDAGRRRAGLSTDSRTGALGLYEHVGMRVRSSYTRYTKTL